MQELSISQKYPEKEYNLLGNISVMVKVPDIKSPVIQVLNIDTNPDHGEVYIQQEAKDPWTGRDGKHHPATPRLYALTKNGLKKLADGAGIKILSSEHVLPASCQKCASVNRSAGKIGQCGNCGNKDVAFRVTVAVPQLTGEVLTVSDTNEIVPANMSFGSDKQKSEFMKFINQICEAKAINGAIRTALHLKGTYTIEELRKPFVCAYLVPNLDHEDVKRAAIGNMFESSAKLFGSAPVPEMLIESTTQEAQQIDKIPDDVVEQYVDESKPAQLPQKDNHDSQSTQELHRGSKEIL